MEIRKAMIADAPSISGLIGSLAHHRSLVPDEPAADAFSVGFSAATLVTHLGDPRFEYLVALAAGDIVGVLGIRDRSSINHFFVANRFQQRGVGRALWEQAKRLGMVGAGERVSVRSSMSAVRVYERFGFVPTGPMVHEQGVMYVPMELPAR